MAVWDPYHLKDYKAFYMLQGDNDIGGQIWIFKLLPLTFPFLQVSVGTLLAFTMVACSVLILRYVPPDEVPLTPSHQESIDTVSLQHSSSNQKIDEENSKVCAGPSNEITRPLIAKEGASADPVVVKNVVLDRCKFVSCSSSCLQYFLLFSAILNFKRCELYVLTVLDFVIPRISLG